MLFMELSVPAAVLAADFKELGIDVRSFRVPLKRAIQQVVAPSIGENFEVGGRPTWEPLSAFTIYEKTRINAFQEPLWRFGTMAKKAQQLNAWEIDGPGGEARMTQVPMTPWGFIHQFGGYAGNGSYIPPRPFAMIQPDDEVAIENIFWDWVGERMEAKGFTPVWS